MRAAQVGAGPGSCDLVLMVTCGSRRKDKLCCCEEAEWVSRWWKIVVPELLSWNI